jgi:hypothetical protein
MTSQQEHTTCRLFGTAAAIRDSHIFPSFAIDYLKKTGSQYLRYAANKNIRRQDGIKVRLLSHEAEQRFGISEKWFAEKIFIPYLERGQQDFVYNEHLYYFSISFLWRVLVLHTDFTPAAKTAWFYPEILKIEHEWRGFLANYTYPARYPTVQLLFTDRITHSTAEVRGFDYYVSRAFDGTIISNEEQSYLAVYGKFLRFVFWAVIKSKVDPLSATSIVSPTGGTISVPQKVADIYLTDFLINRSNQLDAIKASPNQQAKIFQEIEKDREKFWQSDAGQSILNDSFNLNKG